METEENASLSGYLFLYKKMEKITEIQPYKYKPKSWFNQTHKCKCYLRLRILTTDI